MGNSALLARLNSAVVPSNVQTPMCFFCSKIQSSQLSPRGEGCCAFRPQNSEILRKLSNPQMVSQKHVFEDLVYKL